MAIYNDGNGKRKMSVQKITEEITQYRKNHPEAPIRALTNPYNRLVVKMQDLQRGELIATVEYCTDRTVDQITALADIHEDGRFW